MKLRNGWGTRLLWAPALCAFESNFRVEIEEGVQALLKLGLDLFARALKDVHGDVRLVAVGELEGCVVDFLYLAFGEEAHSVDKSQICHEEHLISDQGRGIREQKTRFETAETGGFCSSRLFVRWSSVLYNRLGNSWQS